jgi:hypothetical protein
VSREEKGAYGGSPRYFPGQVESRDAHNFHLLCREMALTFSYLLILPIIGEAVGADDVPNTWRAELGTVLLR